MLQEDLYPIILLVLALATCLFPILIMILFGYKGIRLYQLVASYVFSGNIIKKSTNNHGTTTWLFKDVILNNETEIFLQILKSLFGLFLGLLAGVLLVFYQLLLLDISYSCDENDQTKYCYKLWPKKFMNNHAMDCNNNAIQNLTVDVVCYKFVFSPALAVSVSYFTFQFWMFILNVATSSLLMVKEIRTIGKIRWKMGVLFVSLTALSLAINLSSLRVFFVSANPVFSIQLIITVITGIVFVYYIPWRYLIALKNEGYVVHYTPDNVLLPLSFQSLLTLSNE